MYKNKRKWSKSRGLKILLLIWYLEWYNISTISLLWHYCTAYIGIYMHLHIEYAPIYKHVLLELFLAHEKAFPMLCITCIAISAFLIYVNMSQCILEQFIKGILQCYYMIGWLLSLLSIVHTCNISSSIFVRWLVVSAHISLHCCIHNQPHTCDMHPSLYGKYSISMYV